ncbi:MAG: tetratricopeptide repeat protein [Polyangiaceae bacterium]
MANGSGLVRVGLVAAACTWSLAALGAPTVAEMRDHADRDLEVELETIAPALLPTLKEANRLRRDEKWDQAGLLYQKLRDAAPTFSGATRRMCSVELARGNTERGIALCREASKHETADNLSGLASALLERKSDPAALQEAQQLAERALTLSPNDVWAGLTLCRAELMRGQLEAAEKCIQSVTPLSPPEYAASLHGHYAQVMLERGDSAHSQEAVERAVALAPEDPTVQSFRCELALARGDAETLRECAERLRKIAPKAAQTYYYSAIQRATVGEFSEANDYLDQALANGAPPATVASLRTRIDDAEPWYSKWGRRLAIALVAWVVGLGLLLGLGVSLSMSALRAARTPPSERSGRASGLSAWVRAAYAAVLWLGCAYYYLSIPIVVLLVLALAAAPILGILAAGYVAPKLFIIIGLLVLATLSAMTKGVFARPVERDPGLQLDMTRYPDLKRLLEEVARKVGTRPVDTIFMTPNASVAVFERGGLLRQLRGKSERCLILGAGVLSNMPIAQLRAILAHEYGHFSNRDTAGGGLALAVRRSLTATAINLAHSGAATRFNPAWVFVTTYHSLFLRISLGASRLQEVLADRWAAFSYGSETFAAGLQHVVRRSIEFERHVEATVNEIARSKAGLANLYQHVPEPSAEQSPLEVAFQEALTRQPTPYDSHPSPMERIELVRNSGAEARVETDDAVADGAGSDAWALFPNREELERSLTVEFCSNIYQATGLRLGDKAPAST